MLIGAQMLGGTLGTMLAHLMFELPTVSISTHDRATLATFLAEVVATAGLALVIFGAIRSGRSSMVPVAVGTYIAAAYWFTSSTSFANPAVTVARLFTDSFAGIAPTSVLPFLGAQLLGGLLAVGLIRCLYPQATSPSALEPIHEPTLEGHR